MIWMAFLLWSCNPQTTDKALVQNIAKGLAECREDQINLLVQQNNIQTAFNYCGENSFNSFRWSADGSKLFFGYYGNSYIQDGEHRSISALDIPAISPVKPAWLSNGILAVPLAQKKESKGQNLAWALPDGTYKEQTLSLTELNDLQNFSEDTILFTAKNSDGIRKAYTLTYGETEVQPIFEFLQEPFTRIGYAPQTKILGVSTKDQSKVYREEKLLFSVKNASRVVPHPFADFVVLEAKGEPISILRPVETIGKSEEEIERAQRKQKKIEQDLPDWMDKTYTPNEIHVVDLTQNNRYRIPFFFGEDFEWYTDQGYYCSMTLQGVAGESIHPNVGLLTLRYPLGSIRLNKLDRAELIGSVGP